MPYAFFNLNIVASRASLISMGCDMDPIWRHSVGVDTDTIAAKIAVTTATATSTDSGAINTSFNKDEFSK